jgi:hypothetical protein
VRKREFVSQFPRIARPLPNRAVEFVSQFSVSLPLAVQIAERAWPGGLDAQRSADRRCGGQSQIRGVILFSHFPYF